MAGTRTLVLLRGLNVGGRHCVPMAELRALFERELACSDVATYIQSGNLVCCAPAPGLNAASAAAAIAAHFGFAVPVVVRTCAELASAVAGNPFAVKGASMEHLHAVFLAAPLTADLLEKLEARCVGEEQLAARGRELFLLLPHGAGRSRLALAVAGPAMPAAATMRNWKTVLALDAMLRAV